MGAYVSEVSVYCNHMLRDETRRTGYRTCYEHLEVRCHSIREARAEAKKAGWTVNVRPYKEAPRGTSSDYCPKHKPESAG
jgi:hypothetical protein